MTVETEIAAVREVLHRVKDPEIPVLTIEDLGILRDLRREGQYLIVEITPTYTGCPAMQVIEQDILTTLRDAGFHFVKVRTVLSPAWTTDWMSERGKRKLEAYGIAPPATRAACNSGLGDVFCPQCKSSNTERVSEFGSTPCKALYRCLDCLEPFDHFKCI